ncbi:MAG: hypothetical protein LBC49_01330 [Bacteroidales bacterium]|jgi:hypothetical protein|nr:hypothetical protein [Bacteroidales bacterium]
MKEEQKTYSTDPEGISRITDPKEREDMIRRGKNPDDYIRATDEGLKKLLGLD